MLLFCRLSDFTKSLTVTIFTTADVTLRHVELMFAKGQLIDSIGANCKPVRQDDFSLIFRPDTRAVAVPLAFVENIAQSSPRRHHRSSRFVAYSFAV